MIIPVLSWKQDLWKIEFLGFQKQCLFNNILSCISMLSSCKNALCPGSQTWQHKSNPDMRGSLETAEDCKCVAGLWFPKKAPLQRGTLAALAILCHVTSPETPTTIKSSWLLCHVTSPEAPTTVKWSRLVFKNQATYMLTSMWPMHLGKTQRNMNESQILNF